MGEHGAQLDAWYFLRDLGRLTGEARCSDVAERIRARVLTLRFRWTRPRGRAIFLLSAHFEAIKAASTWKMTYWSSRAAGSNLAIEDLANLGGQGR